MNTQEIQNQKEWQEFRASDPDMRAVESFIHSHPANTEAKDYLNFLEEVDSFGGFERWFKARMTYIEVNKGLTSDYVELILDLLYEGKMDRQFILDYIRRDHNAFDSQVVKQLKILGLLDNSELTDACAVPPVFVRALGNASLVSRSLPAVSCGSSIPAGCTEIYFWGIPSSGKTCAMSGILSTASNCDFCSMETLKDTDSSNHPTGYGYMSALSSIFTRTGDLGALPEGTPTSTTAFMRFNLWEGTERFYPLACIDIAGEIFECMHLKISGESLTDEQSDTLNLVSELLEGSKSGNRKIHFFVIEYGAENKMYKGYSQAVLLNSAVRYIDDHKVFDPKKGSTDCVYVLVTKSDKAGGPGVSEEELYQRLHQYLSDNYSAFLGNLKRLCGTYEINEGRVEVIPFSLGNVCFRDFCLFDSSRSEIVLHKILKWAFSEDKTRWGKFKANLRK